jgi:hypothetical protein
MNPVRFAKYCYGYKIKVDEIGKNLSRMGKIRNKCRILIGKPGRRRPSEDLGVEGKIMLESILEK